ncbi:unnamed protein product [Polarella glacialis]|uniref:Uncharacterized protein n=1 Tax=Polarella glacialis TaxID=89957 RepID=A0A813IT48_POLGL|nr:unnamed protein product [Polarella glacialis]
MGAVLPRHRGLKRLRIVRRGTRRLDGGKLRIARPPLAGTVEAHPLRQTLASPDVLTAKQQPPARTAEPVSAIGAVAVNQAWGRLNLSNLKRWLFRKGLAKELVDASLGAEGDAKRTAVLSFAKAVAMNRAGMKEIQTLAESLGLVDAWRSTKAHEQITKPAAPSLLPPVGAIQKEQVQLEQGQVFEFFESWSTADGY